MTTIYISTKNDDDNDVFTINNSYILCRFVIVLLYKIDYKFCYYVVVVVIIVVMVIVYVYIDIDIGLYIYIYIYMYSGHLILNCAFIVIII